MLTTVLTVIHIIVAVFLILVVLLQTGKGAEMGAAFGGASQTVFGSGGPAGFMAKLTTTAAVLFMVTSLSLAYLSSANARGGAIAPIIPVSSQTTQKAPVQTGDIPAAPTAEQNPSTGSQNTVTPSGSQAPGEGGTAQ
ncbi:protein-export membrane protein SecG [bacterium BMS3Abin14]|nr:protein-export membrane protein SecG [bacterium BMS3Abin14]